MPPHASDPTAGRPTGTANADPSSGHEVTTLLKRWSQGDPEALDAILPLVYEELRRMAGRHMRKERPEHTLEPTGLVHEAYLRLSRHDAFAVTLPSRGHFFALASTLMRHILVDHARAQQALKRGAGEAQQSLDASESTHAGAVPTIDSATAPWHAADQVLALDEALNRLDQLDPDLRQVVECRCFGGLSVMETAQALGRSASTVKRDWVSARAWLLREMRQHQRLQNLWLAAQADAT